MQVKLEIVVPIVLLIIITLLYLNSWLFAEARIVFLLLPFLMVGGLWLMLVLSSNFGAAVAVGFLALAVVAA